MDSERLSITIIFLALCYAIYQLVKLLTNYFLKKSIIKTGHFDRAEILSQGLIVTPEAETYTEPNKYPSLKWGLVAFMAGAGFVLMDLLDLDRLGRNNSITVLPIGIELMFISAGFLLYFIIANYKSKTK